MKLKTAQYLGYIIFALKLTLSILCVVYLFSIINFYKMFFPMTEGFMVLMTCPQMETFSIEFTMHTLIIIATAPLVLFSIKYMQFGLKCCLSLLLRALQMV